jgi:tRNA nucleotidyltransferase (CCA-adding enzyme)
MIHIEIPQDVAFILGKIRNAGYEAYAVGGCVRDSLLKKIPKDWDITTSALPEQIKEIFPRTIDTGIKHGTVTVMINSTGYEVTTYRVDGEYLDGRHPEEVEFTANLDEDLKRRDFTINAFVYNEAEGVKDLFGGLKDLEDGIIRCVGVAEERFGEDALRILRAVRFAAVLSFTIEPETYKAAVKLAGNLSKVSAERIKAELEKTLVSDILIIYAC